MAKKKILFINQETLPYMPESEMAELGRKLPQAMQEKGHEIRTFMPKWGGINERRGQLHEVIRLSGMNLIIDDTDHPLIIKVASIPSTRIQVYFIDNEDFFAKRGPCNAADLAVAEDNGERAIFFARGVLETVKKLRWVPDIIHCQGWMSAVVPLYIKKAYQDEPSFAHAKVVTSLHPAEMTKSLEANFKHCLEFRDVKAKTLKPYPDQCGLADLEHLAIDYSDGVIAGSSQVDPALLAYAKEKGIGVMDYQELNAEAYEEFFNQICPEE